MGAFTPRLLPMMSAASSPAFILAALLAASKGTPSTRGTHTEFWAPSSVLSYRRKVMVLNMPFTFSSTSRVFSRWKEASVSSSHRHLAFSCPSSVLLWSRRSSASMCVLMTSLMASSAVTVCAFSSSALRSSVRPVAGQLPSSADAARASSAFCISAARSFISCVCSTGFSCGTMWRAYSFLFSSRLSMSLSILPAISFSWYTLLARSSVSFWYSSALSRPMRARLSSSCAWAVFHVAMALSIISWGRGWPHVGHTVLPSYCFSFSSSQCLRM